MVVCLKGNYPYEQPFRTFRMRAIRSFSAHRMMVGKINFMARSEQVSEVQSRTYLEYQPTWNTEGDYLCFSFLAAVSSVQKSVLAGRRIAMLTSRVFHGRFFHSPLASLILSNEKRESVLSLTHSLTDCSVVRS